MEDFGIYNVTQALDDLVMKIFPFTAEHTVARVGTEALLGGYVVTSSLQYISEHAVDPIITYTNDKTGLKIPSFHENVLPFCQRMCQYSLPVAALLWAGLDDDSAKIIYEKAMDNFGITKVYVGANLALKKQPLPEWFTGQLDRCKTSMIDTYQKAKSFFYKHTLHN